MSRSKPRPAAALVTDPKCRKFLVSLLVEINVDQRLLDGVLTAEWRGHFYGDVKTAEDVADHLAFNMIQDRRLSSLDGFADQPEDRALIVSIEVDDPAVEVAADPAKAVSSL